MRLAGTCSRYSNSAMPQLASAATYQARPERFFRWAYQAKVMNTFESTSRPVALSTEDSTAGMVPLMGDVRASKLDCPGLDGHPFCTKIRTRETPHSRLR